MVFRAEIIASARTPESRRTPSELYAAKGMAKSSPWKEAVALRKSATASPRPIPGAGIGAYGLSIDRRCAEESESTRRPACSPVRRGGFVRGRSLPSRLRLTRAVLHDRAVGRQL